MGRDVAHHTPGIVEVEKVEVEHLAHQRPAARGQGELVTAHL